MESRAERPSRAIWTAGGFPEGFGPDPEATVNEQMNALSQLVELLPEDLGGSGTSMYTPDTAVERSGRNLVNAYLRNAAGSFIRVRLRKFQPVAVRFYESIGFVQTDEPSATHTLKL